MIHATEKLTPNDGVGGRAFSGGRERAFSEENAEELVTPGSVHERSSAGGRGSSKYKGKALL